MPKDNKATAGLIKGDRIQLAVTGDRDGADANGRGFKGFTLSDFEQILENHLNAGMPLLNMKMGSHASGESAGRFTALMIDTDENGAQVLTAQPYWTGPAAKKIIDKALTGISVEVYKDRKDKRTGGTLGGLSIGAAVLGEGTFYDANDIAPVTLQEIAIGGNVAAALTEQITETNKSEFSNMKKVTDALGLVEGADEASILAAIDALRVEGTDKVAELQESVSTKETAFAALQEQAKADGAKVAELQEKLDGYKVADADAWVDGHQKTGRIATTDKAKATWSKLYLQDAEQAAALIADIKPSEMLADKSGLNKADDEPSAELSEKQELDAVKAYALKEGIDFAEAYRVMPRKGDK